MEDLRWADDLHDDEYPDDLDADDNSADDESDTVSCPACHGQIYADAEQCPLCGRYITHDKAVQPFWWWTAVLVLILLALGYLVTCSRGV